MDGEITPERLEDQLDDGEPVVVDIREPGPFRRGHIPDSLNLPLGDLVHEVDRLADADHVVTVCPHGQASVRAARLIAASAAFDGTVESLQGGLTAWDGPIERESAAAPNAGDEAPDAPF
jgi:rhodanese-related sulfurtransferase